MSHITTCKNKTKFTEDQHLFNALAELSKEYRGLTYQRSADGKIIQVIYDKIDDPVKRYHPNGNLRFNKLKTGEWSMSGDRYACYDETGKVNIYDTITKKIEVNYIKSRYHQFCRDEGYAVSSDQKIEGATVMIARRG